MEHRIGGIEKADGSGNISYDPANHEHMVRLRASKIDGIVQDIPKLTVEDPSGEASVLLLGWGSTYGPIAAACAELRTAGHPVAQAHLRHLNPFPANLGEILAQYRRIVVPEMNLGQLATLLQARYRIEVETLSKVRGLPFATHEIVEAITNTDVESHEVRR